MGCTACTSSLSKIIDLIIYNYFEAKMFLLIFFIKRKKICSKIIIRSKKNISKLNNNKK